MNLTKLFAYEVFPQKNTTTSTQPEGGKIEITTPLRHFLDQLIRDNKLESQTPITFQVDDPKTTKRVNLVRDAMMAFVFGAGANVSKNAAKLALRLSEQMDDRSNPFLFLISGFKHGSQGLVVLWAFPKDEGLKFSKTTKGAKVEVIKDIFNISSNLKKAAVFTGDNLPDSFWEGRMVDIQSGRTDLWVERFLSCQLSVSGIYGTTLLSEHLTEAYRKAESTTVREELFNAIIGVRTAPVKRTSFLKFANDYLSNDAKSQFLAVVPPEQVNMSFDFDRETFEQKIGIRVFRMADDVIVAAPLSVIDSTLHVKNNQLDYSGVVDKEYLKAGKRG
jgi:hypothetical protein